MGITGMPNGHHKALAGSIAPGGSRRGGGRKKQESQDSDFEQSPWGAGFQGHFHPAKVAINLRRKWLSIRKPRGQTPHPGAHGALFSHLKMIAGGQGRGGKGWGCSPRAGTNREPGGPGWGEVALEGQARLEGEGAEINLGKRSN